MATAQRFRTKTLARKKSVEHAGKTVKIKDDAVTVDSVLRTVRWKVSQFRFLAVADVDRVLGSMWTESWSRCGPSPGSDVGNQAAAACSCAHTVRHTLRHMLHDPMHLSSTLFPNIYPLSRHRRRHVHF